MKRARALIKYNYREITTIGLVITLLRNCRLLVTIIEQHLHHSNTNKSNNNHMGSKLVAWVVQQYSMHHQSSPIVQLQQLQYTLIELFQHSFMSNNRLSQQFETQWHHLKTNYSFPAGLCLCIVRTIITTTTILIITIRLMKLRWVHILHLLLVLLAKQIKYSTMKTTQSLIKTSGNHRR